MEPATFNLELAIEKYIGQIKNYGSITGSDAAELKAHLYDATDELKKSRLSDEEAFIIATKRLGTEQVLNHEYEKVNTSVKVNRIWAYLFLGFNLFYSFPALILIAVGGFYQVVYQTYHSSNFSVVIVTSLHILLIALVWMFVWHKKVISKFIENEVENSALRIVLLSFTPALILFLLPASKHQLFTLAYPVREFQSHIAEFSLYVLIMSAAVAALSLVFSLNKMENLVSKSLFEKPSILFLILLSIVVEVFAASTRVIRTDNILISGLIFGSIYAILSFLIAYYNKASDVNKFLVIASLFGLSIEIFVGIHADIERGDTYNTAYFVGGMLLGISAGRKLGLGMSRENITS